MPEGDRSVSMKCPRGQGPVCSMLGAAATQSYGKAQPSRKARACEASPQPTCNTQRERCSGAQELLAHRSVWRLEGFRSYVSAEPTPRRSA